ncbi:MAG: alpha/beta fold hydrolase [Acidobacteriota bacterium]|jgi:alpha/beta superfamily hydrolase
MSQALKRPRRVQLEGHSGIELAGLLQPGRAPSKGALILCHCFTCSKDYKSLAWLSRALAELGFTVLRFDFAGLGESEGDFRDTNLSTDVEDALAAARWIENETHQRLTALIGHSMGGAAAILAASLRKETIPVAVLGTSYKVGDRIRRLLRPADLRTLELTGETSISIQDRLFPLTVEFLRDLEQYDLAGTVAGWRCPFMVIHGTADRIVPLSEGEQLYRAAAQPKSFVAVPGADHLFAASRSYTAALAQILAGWLAIHSTTEPHEDGEQK